jgi:hypothetical protein
MYKWERPDEGNELGPEKVGKMESEERGVERERRKSKSAKGEGRGTWGMWDG